MSRAEILGEPAKARDWYNRAIEITGRIAFRPELALAHLQLAELIAAQFPGDLAEALRHAQLAAEEFRAMKMLPSIARAESLLEALPSSAVR